MWQTKFYPFGGGEDRVTPPITVNPGKLMLSQNYECDFNGGYRRIGGYERFDGRTAPSAAQFVGCLITASQPLSWAVGGTLTGQSSAATMVITSIEAIDVGSGFGGGGFGSGGFGSGSGTQYVVTANAVTGAFTQGETVISSAQTATLNTAPIALYANSGAQYNAALAATMTSARSAITAVPGSGPVRGVFMLNDIVYAFRDNVGATAGTMWMSSVNGWQLVNLGVAYEFTNGTAVSNYIVSRGDVLVGALSGAIGTVVAVSQLSGNWNSATATGVFYLSAESGTFIAGENMVSTVASAPIAKFAGTAPIVIPAGGYYETTTYNFYATAAGNAVYGVNGVGSAFAFDGTTFSLIFTGNLVDTPIHIAAHFNYLFLAFAGGSLQNSALGTPHDWQAIDGAAEIGIGDDITAIQPTTEVMFIFSRNKIHILYGTAPSSFVSKLFSLESGAISKTARFMGRTYFLHDRGIEAMDAINTFGNFASAAISTDIQPILLPKHNQVADAVVLRQRSLYRLFFQDGSGISATFRSNEVVGFTQIKLNVLPYVSVNVASSTGDERIFLGCQDGFVYEMEKGGSFDGQDVIAIMRPHFNHLDQPRMRKRFRKVVFQVSAPVNTVLNFAADFAFGTPNIPSVPSVGITVTGGGALWSTSNWSQFSWGQQVISELEARIDGTGNDIGFLLNSVGQDLPHTVTGAIVHYQPRRLTR